MGRPPKALEGIPPTLEKLTDKQADLLAWVYWKGAGDAITWSAKAYLGRGPTKSEATTLSKRVKGLVDQGVLERNGRDIKLTQEGWVLLYGYAARKQDDSQLRALSVLMDLGRGREDLDSLSSILKTANRYLHMNLVDGEEFEALYEALQPLRRGIVEWNRSLDQALEDYHARTEQ